MYPNDFLNLFPPFPRTHRAFVAMSFSDAHRPRWETIISKGISRIEVNGRPLEPYRIDLGKSGDSVQTEILKEISSCRIVIGEITSIGKIDGTPIRNANVLYEIGIAHASRLPEEVVLFRSDNEPLLFDVTNIRVHSYNPDDIGGSVNEIADVILNSLREVDLRKGLAVSRATSQLDFEAWGLLGETNSGPISHPAVRTMRDVMAGSRRIDSINKLLELGLLEVKFQRFTVEQIRENLNRPQEDLVQYFRTPFGTEVFNNSLNKFGYTQSELEEIARHAQEIQPTQGQRDQG